MPYKNIVFAKLEKRLFHDHRWYMMSETAQLNYIRFILFAAETYNKIPKNLEAIKKSFKTDQDLETIERTIREIKENFPKFKENKHFYYFDEFDTKTNYIPEKEILGKSQILPKDVTDIDIDIEKEKDKEKEPPSADLESAFSNVFKEGLNIYALLNKLKKESKVGADVPESVLLRVIDSYKKNKAAVKEQWPWFCKAIVMEWHKYNAGQNIKESEEFKKKGTTKSIKEILGL